MKILIVEDTAKLAKSLADHFTLQGHNADIVGTVKHAEELISLSHYDIMLLDIMLPDGDGRTFLRSLRSQKISVPIIVMTARSEVSDKVDLLDIGADDYIGKPFEPKELVMRIHKLLNPRFNRNISGNKSYFGEFEFDYGTRLLKKNDVNINLTNIMLMSFLF